jgi:hypothetical protein
MRTEVKIMSFVSLLSTALAMCPYVAHLMALPNKLNLSPQEYFEIQQIYTGWGYSAIVILISFISTCALSALLRNYGDAFRLALASAFCIGISLVIFFMFTYPANQVTENWTSQPYDWQTLRLNWEFSHAANALFYVAAVSLLILSVLSLSTVPSKNENIARPDLKRRPSWHV